MIFEVNKEEFMRAIRPSVEVASKNTFKDFKYENLLTIKAEQDRVVISAYGGPSSLVAPISDSNFGSLNYDCKVEGSATIYADDLMVFMSSLPKNYDRINISFDSNQLNISSVSDKIDKKSSSKRTMPTVSEVVCPPNFGKVFDQEIEVNREVFVKGVESVLFAPAFEEKMYSYMCMLFEGTDGAEQELRFSAGSGGRFAIKSIKGKNIILNKQEASMIFPKDSLGTICKLLSEASQPTITIKKVEANQEDNIPSQIMIEFDEITMCIFGLEHFTKYPPLTKIIEHKYPNRIYSNLEDWKPIVRAIEGTSHRYNDKIHNTEVILEESDEVFKVTPKTTHANPTFVEMSDVENCIVKGKNPWFCCNSNYIKEMVVQGGSKGKVQLNFENQADLDDIPDDKPKQMKPVLIKFPEVVNDAKDIVDNFYMFFSVSTK